MLLGWTERVFPASGTRPWTRAKNRKALIDLSERHGSRARGRDVFFLAGRSITRDRRFTFGACGTYARGTFARVLYRAQIVRAVIGARNGEVHVRIVARLIAPDG